MDVLKKKLGAGLLSLAMLAGGGLHIASAEVDFTVSGNGTNVQGDSTHDPSSSHSVGGYQIIPEGYAANVRWGGMVFVYDKGGYDPSSGSDGHRVTAPKYNSTTHELESGVIGVEIGGATATNTGTEQAPNYVYTEDQVNKWYGFDGVNNKYEVENLSTGSINVDASVNINGSNVGSIAGSLYKAVASSDSASALEGHVSHSAGEGNKWVAWSKTALPAADRNATTGVVSSANSARVAGYLNLTGAPGDNLMGEDQVSAQTPGEKLGDITLTLTKIVAQNP